MSDNSTKEQIKTRKIFVKRDLLVYAMLVILIAGLFVFLFAFKNQSALGFKTEMGGTTLLSHVYGQDFKVEKNFQDKVEITSDGENFLVKIIHEQGYNLLFVNEKEKSVKMLESDCPSQNCVHMQAISNAGAIYCAPRELKITPLSEDFLPPTTGGQG